MGRRDANKAAMRERIAEAAARLFAARGYDDVLVLDVAHAAGVSEQTVYNYFPAKQDLVLDRADEIAARFDAAVRTRPAGTSPAAAILPLVLETVDLMQEADAAPAVGAFAAQSVASPVLRRFALEFRDRQARLVADAVRATDPRIAPAIARAHAAALVSVVQTTTDAVGVWTLAAATGTAPPIDVAQDAMRREATAALDDLDRTFHLVTSNGAPA